METKTNPGFEEPESPLTITLDYNDSTKMDFFIVRKERGYNYNGVCIYIMAPCIEISKFLEGVEGLESRFFPGRTPHEIKTGIREMICLRPAYEDEMEGGNYYTLRYHLFYKDKVYDCFKRFN